MASSQSPLTLSASSFTANAAGGGSGGALLLDAASMPVQVRP